MKKLFTTVLTICVSSALFSQSIPNASFENWTNKGSYQDPDGWGTMNVLTSSTSVYMCEKGTSAPAPNAGSSYLKLTTKSFSGTVMAGFAITGNINFVSGNQTGFPYTSKPTALNGKYQFMAQGGDTGMMLVQLTKFNTTTKEQELVGIGIKMLTGMAMSWSDFSVNISYDTTNSIIPDTCMIAFYSSFQSAHVGSYLYVDALSFPGVTSTNEIDNVYSYNIYPNPAKDKLYIECNLKASSLVDLSITDIQGKLINSTESFMNKGNNQTSMDVSNLDKGIYFITIKSENSNIIKKVIIE